MIVTERVSILFNGVRENWNISWVRFSYSNGKKKYPNVWITKEEIREKDSYSGKTRGAIIFDTLNRKRYTQIWLEDKNTYSVKTGKVRQETEDKLLYLLFKKEITNYEAKIFSQHNERIAKQERLFKRVCDERVRKESSKVNFAKIKNQ